MTTGEWAKRGASFGGVADSYDSYRPGYPAEAVAWLAGDGPARVLDLGAGTGKLTRGLAAAGHDVVAVDPAEPMLARLCEALPGVDARVGSAEDIPADDESFDVVVVAQAFHWFDKAMAVPEIARVLRPRGRLALVWNLRDESEAWVRALWAAIAPDEPDEIVHVELPPGAMFGGMENATFTHSQQIDREAVRGLALSRSYVASRPPERRKELLDAAGAVFDEHVSGHATLHYGAHCFRAEKLARRAARVILLDSAGRTLLLKFAPPGNEAVWVTPGGGLEPRETPAACAARELNEEIGLRVDPTELGQTIAYTSGYADLGWVRGLFRDDFFTYRVDSHAVDTAHMEDLERSQLAEVRWWTPDGLDETTDRVVPRGLADVVRALAVGWRPDRPLELPWSP